MKIWIGQVLRAEVEGQNKVGWGGKSSSIPKQISQMWNTARQTRENEVLSLKLQSHTFYFKAFKNWIWISNTHYLWGLSGLMLDK